MVKILTLLALFANCMMTLSGSAGPQIDPAPPCVRVRCLV